MKRKMKIYLVAMALIVFAGLVSIPFILKAVERSHNSGIDYSCAADEDCAIKTSGCDICKGSMQSCMNRNSSEGICYDFGIGMTCMALSPPPEFCRCEENRCVGHRE